jgi:hypothetical protein
MFPRWADSTLYKINKILLPILFAGTIEFLHIEQVSALFTFRLGQVLLYYPFFDDCHHWAPDEELEFESQ